MTDVNLKQLVRLIVRPPELVMYLNSLVTKIKTDVNYYPEGTEVLAEDWDSLILLDCCRYDVFAENHTFSGRLEERVSRGGGTIEFLRGNFQDRVLHDTVYVTANPQIIRLKEELNVEFHEIVNVWDSGWDSNIQNVPPDVMTQAAKKAADRYPNKRLIFHYNQPHGPFLGKTASESVIGPNRPNEETWFDFISYEIKHELVSSDTWRSGLEETFDIVQPYIKELIKSLDGKVIISADHGEMLGERGSPIPIRYRGHHIGSRHESLVKVPWHIIESGNRRDIVSEPPQTNIDIGENNDDVSERLRDLGYV